MLKNKFLSFLLLFLSGLNFANAQEKSTHFKDILGQSYAVSFTETDGLVCKINTDQLIIMMAKDDWLVSELAVVDCLVQKASESTDQALSGIVYYIGGMAYNDFDDEIKENLFQKAYIQFKKTKDIEGEFFSLLQLLNSKIKSTNPNDQLSSENLNESYKELAQIAKQTNFIPVQLLLYESQMRKIFQLNEDLSSLNLDHITEKVTLNASQYPNISRDLYTVLGIAYQKKGEFDTALKFKHKALDLANTNRQDYPSFYLNIGGTYFYKKNLDSAKYYIKKSYDLIPQELQTSYQLTMKRNVAFNLGHIYKLEDKMDSAYHYTRQSYNTSKKLMQLQLNENRTYADKKFEVQKNELQLAQTKIELLENKRTQVYLTIGIGISFVLAGILLFFYKKSKQLQKESLQLAKNRERLLQIISHDLIAPLQVLTTSAEVLPELIAEKQYKQVAQVQASLADTITAQKNLLKNLMSWNVKMQHKKSQTHKEKINISETLENIVNAYLDLAKNKDIEIKTHIAHDVVAMINASEFSNLARNIIYNAVKHGATHSQIDIHLKKIDESQFMLCCQNTVSTNKLASTEKFVSHINNPLDYNFTSEGLGLELMFDAIGKLNAKMKAQLKEQSLNICCSLPIYDK